MIVNILFGLFALGMLSILGVVVYFSNKANDKI